MSGRVVHIGGATLILGDCLSVLPTLPRVDACITDPPYGVGVEYASTKDTPEFVSDVVLRALWICRAKASRVVLTPGIKNLFLYPKPTHTGAIYYPAGAGMNPWGFTCWQPILYYGGDPYGGKGSRPDSFSATDAAEKNGHPCPKPIGQMRRIVDRSTLPGETVLDPFMGSGGTGAACVQLGRPFIGIEIDEGYFEIACKRIQEAHRQPNLFLEADRREPTQAALFDEAAA